MGEKVLRSVLQKQGPTNFSNTNYAFGTQGVYTKMFSGLNLEQELCLGGAKEISYESLDNSYKIIEKHFLNRSNTIYYEVETIISKTIQNFLTGTWNLRDDNFLVNSTQNSDPYLFLVTEEEAPQDSIKITLSAVNINNNTRQILKKKYIVFSQDSGKKYISEILVMPSEEVAV